MTSVSLLEVSNLHKSYDGISAVAGVSFDVEGGQVFGLLGPNGAGKTTTLLMLAGLLQPDLGEIRIERRPFVRQKLELRGKVGWVPQSLAIYADLTVRENLLFFGRLYRLDDGVLRNRAEEILGLLNLEHAADRSADTLSGGQKRRLNLGIALVHRPKVLILDEATTGLDPPARSKALETIRGLARRGAAIVYASHYLEEIQTLCDQAALLDHGRILQQGSPTQLLDRWGLQVELRITGFDSKLRDRLGALAGVEEDGDGMRILVPGPGAVPGPEMVELLAEIMNVLKAFKAEILSIRTPRSDLDHLFSALPTCSGKEESDV